MSEQFGTEHWPVEVRVKQAEKEIEIEFDDGKTETVEGMVRWDR